MRPATGKTDPTLSAIKVSIQLALDGHSFSVAESSTTGTGEGPVFVEVLSPRTMLVPEALFAEGAAAELLAAAGMPALASDSIVWSAPRDGVVAVMAAGREAVDAVRSKFGDRVRFTTPLLSSRDVSVPTTHIHRSGGICYIKIYDPALRMAEAVCLPSEVDLLCFLERIGTSFPLRTQVLHLTGDDAKGLRKSLKNLFKKVVCE